MRVKIGNFLLATATLAGMALMRPVQAEVSAGEVLGWCDGASQPGQLGTINALRCVNYLQGAAEMVQALSETDFAACLEGSQSVGTQLMARFVPELRAHTAAGITTPVARQVADWLAGACAVTLSVTATADESGSPASPAVAELQSQLEAALEARDAAQLAARTSAEEAATLRSALGRASAGQDGELLACNSSLDRLSDDLASAESAASENAMRVAELELELEAVDAEAMARRQEITAATDRITALSAQFDEALAAKRREIEDAQRRIDALAADLDTALSQRAEAELALSGARQDAARLATAESQLALSTERVETLEQALEASRDRAGQLEDELQTALRDGIEHTALISALEGDLAACDVSTIRAESPMVPPPLPTPEREPAPPSAVATAPTLPSAPANPHNRVEGSAPRTGGNISNGNARYPGSGGANISIASQPRDLDTLGLLALRQTQQLALYDNEVGERREWASLNGEYTGYVEVLREGYQYGDFCREVLSVARSGGAEVHRQPERYCLSGNLWVYRR